jgi:uracil phosphoribosyltransferase
VSVTVVDHALAGHLLAQLRSVETAPPVFRTLAKRLALTLALEAIRDLPAREITVRTPLEETTGRVLDDLVAVPILRAGLGMLEAVTELFPEVAVGYIGLVKEGGPASIRFVCVVAAPEGIQKMEADHPDVPIFTAAIDRQLNERGYIVPGLGDFGDRLFGTE